MKPSSAENAAHYLTGFAFALGLTLLAFMLVSAKAGLAPGPLQFIPQAIGKLLTQTSRWAVLSAIFALAVVQIGVHLRYFLHLDFSPKQRPMLQVLLFSLLIIFIVVCGTLWIMHDLNRQMMPR